MTLSLEQLVCPVDGCDWQHVRVPPPVGPGTLASVFGPGVMQAVALASEAEDAERAVREHMEDHSDEEFLRTIVRAQGELAALRKAMLTKAHVWTESSTRALERLPNDSFSGRARAAAETWADAATVLRELAGDDD